MICLAGIGGAGGAGEGQTGTDQYQTLRRPPSRLLSVGVGFDTFRHMSRTLHVSEPLHRWHSEGLFHPFPITQMCFTPDGRGLLAADGGGDVRRWDAAAWTRGAGGGVVNAAPKDQPRGVARALSPRGDVVATADYAAFTLRPGDGSAARTFEVGTPLQHTAAAALTPDASALAVGGGYRGPKGMAYALWVWDAATGEERYRVKLKGEPQRLVFAPDGSWLAAIVYDKPIHLFDARSGEVLATLKVGSSELDRLIVSDDGRRLAAAGYGTIRVWDTANWELVKQKKVKAGGAGSEEVSDIAFLPGGPGRSLRAMSEARSYSSKPTRSRPCARSRRPASRPRSTRWPLRPMRPRLSFSAAPRCTRWTPRTVAALRQMSGHVSGIFGLDFDAAGERLLTYDYAEQGFTWSVDGSPPRRLNLANRERVDQYDEYQYAALSPDGRTVASAGRRMLRLWDVQTGRLVHKLPEAIGYPRPLRFSPDGRWLAYHDERAIEGRSPGDWCLDVLDLDTGEVRRRLEQRDAIGDVSFSPDGQLLAAVTGYGLQLVRTAGDEEPRLVYDPRQRDHLIGGFLWSADGTRVSSLATGSDTAGSADASGVSGDDLVLCTWDVDTGEVVDARVLPGKAHRPGVVVGVPGNVPVSAVASSAGTFVLRDELDLPPTSHDGRLVDPAGGEVIVRNLREMQVYSGGLTLSGDGRRLAAASGDHSVAVWDLSEAAGDAGGLAGAGAAPGARPAAGVAGGEAGRGAGCPRTRGRGDRISRWSDTRRHRRRGSYPRPSRCRHPQGQRISEEARRRGLVRSAPG